jgi:outer membrane protein TolC
MKKFTISILLILFSITAVYSQQDTLIYKYRRLAVDYQQSVKMAQRDLAGAESMLDAAKSDFLPKLDFYGGYNYLGVPIQMASSTEGQTGAELQNFYSLDMVISQPIITGGYLKNTRNAAQSQAEVMRDFVNLSEQEVMINSDVYYWNAVTKKEVSSLLIKYRDAIGQFQKVIQDRVDEEVVGMNELYQAKVRYNDAEYDVIRTEKDFMISIMELNRMIGLPVNTPPDVADSLLIVIWAEADINLSEKALQQRPEISLLENKISMNSFNEKVTASQYNPQFGVGVGGNWGAPSPGLSTDPAFNYNLQAKLAIPIYYWGKKKEEVFASRQLTEISKLEMEQTKDMITLEVESSYFDLQQSQYQLDFADGSLDNASKNVEVMLDRYYEGLSSVLEVLDAQLFWQKSYLNYIEAKFELNMAYSSYQKAMGELVISQ